MLASQFFEIKNMQGRLPRFFKRDHLIKAGVVAVGSFAGAKLYAEQTTQRNFVTNSIFQLESKIFKSSPWVTHESWCDGVPKREVIRKAFNISDSFTVNVYCREIGIQITLFPVAGSDAVVSEITKILDENNIKHQCDFGVYDGNTIIISKNNFIKFDQFLRQFDSEVKKQFSPFERSR